MFFSNSNDCDQERQSFLGRLFDGKNSTCLEQLRVSKSAFKQLCEILQGIGGLVRTRNVSIEESVAIFFNILAHNVTSHITQGSGSCKPYMYIPIST